jgi:hypothetical protein
MIAMWRGTFFSSICGWILGLSGIKTLIEGETNKSSTALEQGKAHKGSMLGFQSYMEGFKIGFLTLPSIESIKNRSM